VIGLLVAFGVTLAVYVIWVITLGAVNAIQFLVVWSAVILSIMFRKLIGYLIAVLGALVLTFPISGFVYFPEKRRVQIGGGALLVAELHDPKTYAMIALYIAVSSGALYLMRGQRRAGQRWNSP